MRPRGALAAALAALALLALDGCGSSSLSAAQLRSDAGPICAAAAARTQAIPMPATPAAAAGFLQRGVHALSPELGQLRRLRAPATVAKTYATATQALADELGLLNAAIARLRHGADPVASVQALQSRLTAVEARGDAAWRALEIPGCLAR